MSEWLEALAALEADSTLTAEQYEKWLEAGNGKFYDFFRAYTVAIGRAEERESTIELLEGLSHPGDWIEGRCDCLECKKIWIAIDALEGEK